MRIADIVTSDPQIMGGKPVFVGTRVPVDTLFVNLADGMSTDDFVEHFPSVNIAQVAMLLHWVSACLNTAFAPLDWTG